MEKTSTEELQKVLEKIKKAIGDHLPEGFSEGISYGMPAFVVPHEIYPRGYHAKPGEPLPYISLAVRKNYLSMHHMGLYSDEKLLKWFLSEYEKVTGKKADIGKGCVRFKSGQEIPYDLIGKLAAKISVEEWISFYENNLARKK